MPRRLGQHFLRDQSVLAKIVVALDLSKEDSVLEIGPGRGVLTRELARRAGHVTAVELDGELAHRLRDEFEACRETDEDGADGDRAGGDRAGGDRADGDRPGGDRAGRDRALGDRAGGERNGQIHEAKQGRAARVSIVQANALDADPCQLMPPGYKLAGNIPYYISGALIRKYLTVACKPRSAVLMVQLEVAQRMLGQAGDMSLLGIGTQLYADASIVTRVPAGAFNPPPKVESAVVKLEVLPAPRVSIPDEGTFFRVVRAGFGTRRKQLANAIAQGLDVDKPTAISLLDQAGIAPTRRAEELTLEEWSRLAWSVAEQPYGLAEDRH